jgi:hypothetical protein
MKRKPLEKLSDRLTKLFLSHVKEFDIFYFDKLNRPENDFEYKPIELAKKMSHHVMKMIAEYEPEDIE